MDNEKLPYINYKPNVMKNYLKIIIACFYYVMLFFKKQKDRRIVLNYHSVLPEDCEQFEKQIAYITKNFNSVTTATILSDNGGSKMIAVTFDDAFKNFMDNAEGIMSRYNARATIFVPTDYIGKFPAWYMSGDCTDHNEVIMDEEQLRILDQKGVELLSHTATHPFLTEIDDKQLEYEIYKSKSTLETILGHSVDAISYPHGDHDKKVCEMVRSAGYKYGFTIEPSFICDSPDKNRIGRFSVSPNDSMLEFILKVNGAYSYLYSVKKFLNKVSKF